MTVTKANDNKCTREAERRQVAAEWLLRVQALDVSPEELLAWEAWMKANAENRRAFDAAERAESLLVQCREQLADVPLPSDAEVKEDAYDGSVPVREWIGDRGVRRSRHRRSLNRARRMFGVAALVVLSLGALFFVAKTSLFGDLPSDGLSLHTTDVSEHRNIDLPDGSSIALGAASALSINYSSDRRTVVMERGEALFDIAEDTRRPFVVVAGSGTITAVGTAFNVRRDADRVVVTVTEGKVEVANTPRRMMLSPAPKAQGANLPAAVARTTLAVGERAVYDKAGIDRLGDVELTTATAWRDGRLQYRAEPLKHVLPDVDRYSTRDIIIGDASIGDLTFTGTVFHHNADEWLLGLEQVFPVEVIDLEGGRVLLRSSAGDSSSDE